MNENYFEVVIPGVAAYERRKNMNGKIEPGSYLGFMAMDRVTGFKGTVTAFCFRLSGHHTIELTPIKLDGGYAEERWFDLTGIALSQKIVRHDFVNLNTGESKAIISPEEE